MKDKPRVLLFAAALSAALWTTASENRMVRLHNTDGTSTVLCTDDVRKISFLAPGVDDKGITMHFTDGKFVTVYFCDEPSVSFGEGSVTLSSAGDTIYYNINGLSSNRPFSGFNIVKESDGSTHKMMYSSVNSENE